MEVKNEEQNIEIIHNYLITYSSYFLFFLFLLELICTPAFSSCHLAFRTTYVRYITLKDQNGVTCVIDHNVE